MEFMEQIFGCLNFPYILTVIFITYFVIGFWFKSKSSSFKRVVTLTIGIIFAIVWYYLIDLPLDSAFPSFATAVVLYDWLIKLVLKALKITYTNLDNKLNKNQNENR